MTPEYEAFKASVVAQRKVVARKQALADKQRTILTELLKKCEHEELKEESSYYGGDYYNKAHSEYWMQCTLCGERGPKKTEMHSYYG
jgi:hypothetical protein